MLNRSADSRLMRQNLQPDFRWAEPAKVHVRSRVGSIDSSSKYLDNCDMIKALHWLGSSLEDVSGFPIEARRQLGFELFAVQVGQMPSDFKPMPQIGKGAYEIRVHVLGEWRLVYVARQADTVFVLHAFHKKTQKTRKADLQLAARRYQQITGD